MTALDRAVALAQVNDIAVRVREHLHFHVPWVLQVPLHVDRSVREVGLTFALGGLERARRLSRAAHDLQAFSAPTRRCLDRDRPAELVAQPADLLGALDRLSHAGNDRHARGAHTLARLDLQAHRLDRGRRRADPDDPRIEASLRELRVLRQEPVARVDGLCACPARGVKDPLLVQVALAGRPSADEVRLVRVRDVRGVPVGLRVDRDRPDPELAQRSEHPDRDLAAIRHQHFPENGHCHRILQSMSLPDALTVARAASVPFVVLLYAWNFNGHNYWATALLAAAMATDWVGGRIARGRGHSSPLGSLLDPAADKILVLAVLIMLVEQGVAPGWMVALIVVREFLVTALRLAALERGVVLQARDLGKLKTWSQALAAAIGGFAAAGAWSDDFAWWAVLIAFVPAGIPGLHFPRRRPRFGARRRARLNPALRRAM